MTPEAQAYIRTYLATWKRARRAEAIARLGGCCSNPACGSTRRLEFDHIDPLTKTIKSNHLLTCSKAKFEAEIAKCQLLCHTCHRAKTTREILAGII